MTEEEATLIIWNYHHVAHQLQHADIIFVLGSNDPRVASYAAQLYHQGWAPRIVFSGGVGRFTNGWSSTEAELFGDVATRQGVPHNAILLETKATNTGENIKFTRQLIQERGWKAPQKILALQKPYMERRTLATLEAQWKGPDFIVSSPHLSFEEYLTPELTKPFVINAMVGDFQRILEYPKMGFSTPQPVTAQEIEAFLTLVEKGYSSQLLPGTPLPSLP
jgi:uncharacterized SAM-binding protein YcdF (DUF218 family)